MRFIKANFQELATLLGVCLIFISGGNMAINLKNKKLNEENKNLNQQLIEMNNKLETDRKADKVDEVKRNGGNRQ